MAANDTFTVAVELGSSEVSVVVGRKDADGGIKVLASLQEPSSSFIRKGRINNIDKMTQFLVSMRERLEKQLKQTITQMYVGIGGMGMHTVPNKVERTFAEKVKITEELVKGLEAENEQFNGYENEILEVVPQEYLLDAQKSLDPVGMLAEHITGNYLNVMAASSAREQIISCFHEAGIGIAGTPLTILSQSLDMTNESERRSGCVIVDMGAETTSVVVYRNNLLRHLAVLPLGGANITRDLASVFNIDEEEAEVLKRKYIHAVMDAAEVANHKEIAFEDGRTVRFADFFEVAQARLEEIVLNVKNQVNCSGFYHEQLIGGFILTGGVAQLKGIENAYTEFAEISKVVVRQNLPIQVRAKDDFNRDGSFNSVISMLDKNNGNCCGGPLGETRPQEIFPTAEELAAKAEADRLATEEAERLRLERERLAAEEAEQSRLEEEERQRKKAENSFSNRFKKATSFLKKMLSEDDAKQED